MVPVLPPLIERETLPEERAWDALEWQGEVRLAADRASGLSAPAWQQRVRTGLLERALVLGADHREGPHLERPEIGSRLLAHIDALAEAGLSPAELRGFAEEAELDHPGALWVLTLLFGCLDVSDAEEELEAWVASLDASLFLTYQGIEEIAGALRIQPNPLLRRVAQRWLNAPSPVLVAIVLELMSPDQLSGDLLLRLGRMESPLVHVALERCLARSPARPPRPIAGRQSWIDLPVPALACEAARARILGWDLEPLFLLRQGDTRAIEALGPGAVDLFALAGEGRDGDLVADLVRAFPTTPRLLDAIGRAGLASLFPRLLSALEDDDVDEDAHQALATALGPRVERPSRQAWEQVIAALPSPAAAARLRGGELHARSSIIEEMKRPELSVQDLRARADEVFMITGRPVDVEWDAFGISLEGAISELARLAR
jgi:hypothetical protein